jgi:NADH-quinone oxidoreductase subunit N
MTVPISFHDLLVSAPVTIVAIAALLVLLVDSLVKRSESLVFWLTLASLVAAAVTGFTEIGSNGKAYGGMLATGGYGAFFAVLFSVACGLSVMLSRSYIRKDLLPQGEYYALLLLSVTGMMLMAASTDLIIFFLGLELMSVCFYILAGFARSRAGSNEAALKYFLLGAFATGFLLYGIALLYGATGTTNIDTIVSGAATHATSPMFLIGLGLLLVGLAFKIAAVPFHMWVPDVYEGSPTTVSGFMSTGGKAAAFSVFLLLFAPRLINVAGEVRVVLATLSALSMIFGNLIALAQSSIKRMLAYSSVAHAGYLLCGVIAGNTMGGNGVLFYLAAYTAMNIGAFGILAMGEAPGGRALTFDDYAGLSTQRPVTAALMAVFMFSLAGIPPFAGFLGKYYVFAGVVQAGFTWLAILGVLMSVVSAYYYLRVVVVMYFREHAATSTAAHGDLSPGGVGLGYAALVIAAVLLLQLGVLPSTVLNITSRLF